MAVEMAGGFVGVFLCKFRDFLNKIFIFLINGVDMDGRAIQNRMLS